MDARTPVASRREVGKAERRARIVEAAAELLREGGFDGVSMVQIAERAGVAPATVYNLFSTKAAIIRQVFDLDLEAYRRRLARGPAKDPIARMFASIELAAELYERDPAFYRAMARAGGEGAGRLRSAISEPRVAFWLEQAADAVAMGALRPETPAEVLGVMLSQIMRGVFAEWAVGAISAARLAKESAYGVALALLAYASEATAPGLQARVGALEKDLAAAGRERRG